MRLRCSSSNSKHSDSTSPQEDATIEKLPAVTSPVNQTKNESPSTVTDVSAQTVEYEAVLTESQQTSATEATLQDNRRITRASAAKTQNAEQAFTGAHQRRNGLGKGTRGRRSRGHGRPGRATKKHLRTDEEEAARKIRIRKIYKLRN